jgi:hypothetical protein
MEYRSNGAHWSESPTHARQNKIKNGCDFDVIDNGDLEMDMQYGVLIRG